MADYSTAALGPGELSETASWSCTAPNIPNPGDFLQTQMVLRALPSPPFCGLGSSFLPCPHAVTLPFPSSIHWSPGLGEPEFPVAGVLN